MSWEAKSNRQERRQRRLLGTSMNSWKFSASTVRCCIEDDVVVVGFGDDSARPTDFLIMTRMLDDESEGCSAGIQTSRSTHELSSAVTSVQLAARTLLVWIRPECASGVGGSEISIDLSGAHFDRAELIHFLHKLFDGGDVFLRIAD